MKIGPKSDTRRPSIRESIIIPYMYPWKTRFLMYIKLQQQTPHSHQQKANAEHLSIAELSKEFWHMFKCFFKFKVLSIRIKDYWENSKTSNFPIFKYSSRG